MRAGGARALTGVFLTAVLALAGTESAVATPSLELGDDTVGIGQSVAVTGAGWPAGTLVTIEACGNEAVDGSVDCDQMTSRDVGVRQDGRFATVFRVARPQQHCPCVIRVSSPSEVDIVTHPITVVGAPAAEVKSRYQFPAIERLIDVRSASLADAGPWTAWFGAAPERTLVLDLVNVGDATVTNPGMTLTWGKGSEATELVPVDKQIGELAPGEAKTLRIPVRLESLAFGGYRVEGEIHGLGEPVSFEVRTSSYPWGLFALGLVLVQLLLLKLRNAVRRRVAPDTAEANEEAGAEKVAEKAERTEKIDKRSPRRTLREVLEPALTAVGRPVERFLARREARRVAPEPERVIDLRDHREPPGWPATPEPLLRKTNGSRRPRPLMAERSNGHHEQPRRPRDAVSPLLVALGEPVYRIIRRHDRGGSGSDERREERTVGTG